MSKNKEQGSGAVVQLVIVDLLRDVNEDASGARLIDRIERYLDGCAVAIAVGASVETEPNCGDHSKATPLRMRKQITKFMKVQDKYLSYGSTLLKSRAYHQTVGTATYRKPVVELPRTTANKPYIPAGLETKDAPRGSRLSSTVSTADAHLADAHPLGISHQFPFVASALGRCGPRMGLDVVMFDLTVHESSRLYADQDEFLCVFRDNLTDREWRRIHAFSDPSDRLRGLYLHWGMKEAYTKALGLGVGVQFGSFDVNLDEDIKGDGEEPIWRRLFDEVTKVGGRSEGVCPVDGHVIYRSRDGSALRREDWSFSFLPLRSKSTPDAFIPCPDEGCACVSMESCSDIYSVNVEHLSLWELEEYHRPL